MSNPHIVIGEKSRCICGVTDDGQVITCDEIINALERLNECVLRQSNPSLFIRKGDRDSSVPRLEDIAKLITVIRPLIVECDSPQK